MNNISVDLIHSAVVSISRVVVAHYHRSLSKMPLRLLLLLLLLLLLHNSLMLMAAAATHTAVLVTGTRAPKAGPRQGTI